MTVFDFALPQTFSYPTAFCLMDGFLFRTYGDGDRNETRRKAWDIMLEQGVGARSVRLNLPKFTLIGATTRQGKLSAPLRSRFTMTCRLDYYNAEELSRILKRTAQVLGFEAEAGGLEVIAKRSRGTPRIANNLIKWVRDFAQVKKQSVISADIADQALTMLDIDPDGLDEMDKIRRSSSMFLRRDGFHAVQRKIAQVY